MTEKYIGTKIVLAEPMDETSYLNSCGRHTETIGRETRPGYRVHYEDGYVSWSPKETFERAYRKITDRELKLLS